MSLWRTTEAIDGEEKGLVSLLFQLCRSYLGDEFREIVRSNTIHGIVVLLVEDRKFFGIALVIGKTTRALHSFSPANDRYLCYSEDVGEGCVNDDEENQRIGILGDCLIVIETDVEKANQHAHELGASNIECMRATVGITYNSKDKAKSNFERILQHVDEISPD